MRREKHSVSPYLKKKRYDVMTTVDDALLELQTEELPPKNILKLASFLNDAIRDQLQKGDLAFDDTVFYATPRRLAVLIKGLSDHQPEQKIERKGPALSKSFDQDGKPTPACLGFARSCGVAPADLSVIETEQGSFVSYTQHLPGQSVQKLLPSVVSRAIQSLPMEKNMRWGSGDATFIRPVRSVILLFSKDVVPTTILGCVTGRETEGHRFLSQGKISIPHPSQYEAIMYGHYVVADFSRRRELIRTSVVEMVHQKIGKHAEPELNHALLNEVTGLVEWPVALMGKFEEVFLSVPEEVLISAMQVHQRYFPVKHNGTLLPYFVTVSNIESQQPERVIRGNERVLRARLSDAAFFFNEDKKTKLQDRVSRLKTIVYHDKLGSLFDKSTRMSQLSAYLATELHSNPKLAAEAGLLAKADLTTEVVSEFPELQGVMGFYYAKADQHSDDVASALKEYYLPRFYGDDVPSQVLSQCLALADRIDLLVGLFGVNQIPTGDKDPYGLRRAAVGVIRILIETKLDLDLRAVLKKANTLYSDVLPNAAVNEDVFTFIQERLRAWYLERGIPHDVIQAVLSLGITHLSDIDARISAVKAFKDSSSAASLSAANKRVCNILNKLEQKVDMRMIDFSLLEHEAERNLAQQLELKRKQVEKLAQQKKYDDVLLALADLRYPIDAFFDEVMVMTEDQPRRHNRLLLLAQIRALFLQVADIALLQ